MHDFRHWIDVAAPLSETHRIKRTLYVCQPLLNADAIRAWGAEQGFASILDNMHVTIAFSKQPVAWQQFSRQRQHLTVHGGERRVIALGDKGAVVLRFTSRYLQHRWQMFCDGGAEWQFPIYRAHVTLTYDAPADLHAITPYLGDLVFGPERFAVVDADWHDKLTERPCL